MKAEAASHICFVASSYSQHNATTLSVLAWLYDISGIILTM